MALEPEHGVLRVEAHADSVLLLQEHRFEQVGRFLGQDERCVDFGRGLRFVFHQLVRIGSDERQRLGGDIDEDAVHDGAQLVVGRGENGLVDAVDQQVHVQRQLLLLGAQLRHGGIAHGAGAGDRQRAALPVDADLPVLVVDVDRQRQLRELLQRVEHQFGRCGDRTLALDVVDRNLADERGLQVGGRDAERVALELHEEVVEDGQRILVADDLARCRQKRQEGGTRYCEFHLFTIYICYVVSVV